MQRLKDLMMLIISILQYFKRKTISYLLESKFYHAVNSENISYDLESTIEIYY